MGPTIEEDYPSQKLLKPQAMRAKVEVGTLPLLSIYPCQRVFHPTTHIAVGLWQLWWGPQRFHWRVGGVFVAWVELGRSLSKPGPFSNGA